MKVATEDGAANVSEDSSLPASPGLAWQRWASFAALLPLALASYQLSSLLVLPLLAILFVLALILIARVAGWPSRLLAFDLTVILATGMFAVSPVSCHDERH